jgi:hypothetical protein
MFATSIGEHALGVLFAMAVLMYFAFKLLTTIDDDGEIRKTAKAGFAQRFSKLFKE